MKIFALSDLHVDFPANRSWVEAMPAYAHREDLLVVAGDVSDSMDLMAWCFETLASRFAKVLFVPGNHELWVLGDPPAIDSMAKFWRVRALAHSRGVVTGVLRYGRVSIVPLMSWYDGSFGTPSALLTDRWMDYRACRWVGNLAAHDICSEFLRMNEAVLDVRNDTVISVSHFVPRADLLPATSEVTQLLLPVMGSRRLEAQVRRLNPAIHVYGHSHRRARVQADGITYVNAALGYPRERGGREAELCCLGEFDSCSAERTAGR